MIEKEITKALAPYASEEKRIGALRFFKTGKGEYGEGCKYLGVVVPDRRKMAAQYEDLTLVELEKVITNEYQDLRFIALVILVNRFKKSKSEEERKTIYNFYLKHTSQINNWDLVDVSARYIVGRYLLDKKRDKLYELSQSSNMWEQRIAIIATHEFISNNDLKDTLKLSEIYLTHTHDLMHKATGWMLRELGKKDKNELCKFLDKYHKTMPRTMLRYSIEHFTDGERKHYMAK